MADLFGERSTEVGHSVPADWTRGYALDHLKALGAPFRAASPYVHGAFGYAKERDIASSLAEGSWHADSATKPSVAAIARTLKVASRRHDFRGDSVIVPSGDTVIWEFGMSDGAEESAVASVLDNAFNRSSRAQWVEWFEEDERKRMLEQLGFQFVASRIAAGSEIKGLYVRSPAPTDWRFRVESVTPIAPPDRTAVALLRTDFISESEHAEIVAELSANAPWNQHYSNYNKRHSWTAFALRGYSDDPGFIIKPKEMSEKWKQEHPGLDDSEARWTSIASLFPSARRVIDRVCGAARLDRVRFMRLAASSGELTRHADITDRDAGTADGRVSRLHIPIVTRPSCLVSSWGIRGLKYERHFPERSLCYLDQRRPHAVRNPESIDRIHLVIDVYADDNIRGRFASAVWRCDD